MFSCYKLFYICVLKVYGYIIHTYIFLYVTNIVLTYMLSYIYILGYIYILQGPISVTSLRRKVYGYIITSTCACVSMCVCVCVRVCMCVCEH